MSKPTANLPHETHRVLVLVKDGYRAQLAGYAVERVLLRSRRGTDMTAAFPEIRAAALAQLPAGTGIDGESPRGNDLSGWPYARRRAALGALFAERGLTAPFTLCPSTTETAGQCVVRGLVAKTHKRCEQPVDEHRLVLRASGNGALALPGGAKGAVGVTLGRAG
ncbi:hypothetical protein [Streptomyces sp. NPDC048341]|uniref:hypothetical protein n=1 Tax=Streptomyces sp. NPDC048341 TaxID=3154620 RepID=UPI00341D3FA7